MEQSQNKIIQTRLGEFEVNTDKILTFPRGLLGLEMLREFTLVVVSPESPFLLLQSLESPEVGFLVTDPYLFMDNYVVKVGDAEQASLKAKDITDMAVLVTVSIPSAKPERTTLNLTGPILINHQARLGMQVPQTDSANPSSLCVYMHGTPEQETPVVANDTMTKVS